MSRHYRRDPDERAAGCLLALVIAAVFGLIYVLIEAFKYRPPVYTPASPYDPENSGIPTTPRFYDLRVDLAQWSTVFGSSIVVGIGVIGGLSTVRVGGLSHWLTGLSIAWACGCIGVNGGLVAVALWRDPPQTTAQLDDRWLLRYLHLPALVVLLRSIGVITIFMLPFVIQVIVVHPTVRFVLTVGGLLFGAVAGSQLWEFSDKILAWQPQQQTAREQATALLQQQQAEVVTHQPPQTIYTLYPAHSKADYVSDSKLLAALLATAPCLTFQIIGTKGETIWRVVDPTSTYEPARVMALLKSHLPPLSQVVFHQRKTSKHEGLSLPFYRQHLLFDAVHEYGVPLPFLEHMKVYDPLMAITQHMGLLETEDRIVYSVMTLTSSAEARRRAQERFRAGFITPLTMVRQDVQRQSARFEFDEAVVTAKLSGELYHCYLVVTVESSRPQRVGELAQLAYQIPQFQLLGHNQMRHTFALGRVEVTTEAENVVSDFAAILESWVREYETAWRLHLLVLSPAEIAALWHLPNETFTSRRIAWAGPPVPAELLSQYRERVWLGEAVGPQGYSPVSLTLKDRAYHHYIAGKTGMGKSTLLHNLIHQDIQAGRSVVVIDPHGKLIDDILGHSIPEKRVKDVVLLECGNREYPVPLNPLRIPTGVSYETAFNYLYWILRKLYESVWRDRMDLVYRNVLHALLCDPAATPLDIDRIFTSHSYRDYLIERMDKHPQVSTAVQAFWRDYGRRGKSEQAEMAAPIRNRTAIFLGNRALELMTCHPQMLNFRSFIEQKKIVLINLSGEAIRSEVGSLGLMFLSGFYMANETLGYLADNQPPRCFVYVDEVERIVSSPIPEMFAHERKFGLSLTLANQYLDQLSEATLNGILGNVGTLMLFECGERDARRLGLHLEPDIERGRLLNLGAYQAVVKTRYAGRTLPAFVLKTRPAPKARSALPARELRAALLRNSKLPTSAAVAAWLTDRYTVKLPQPEPSTDGNHHAPLEDYE
ncbi:MAG: type IV secretion system DNA-binding domain-containing protein [Anaerolineae bacterium]|nr:type IV secretion system DNA-binding domain-containing protein [Anaerolineae bacterium]